MTIQLSIYFLFSFFVILIITKLSYKLNLVDFPNKRKIHKFPVAFTGGISLCICIFISNYIFTVDFKELNSILSMSILIAFIGLLDDKYSLNIGGKLSLLVIPTFYLVIFENIYLKNLGDYYYFNIDLYNFAIPFTILSVLFLINSFNYFDGLDGVLGLNYLTVIFNLYIISNDETMKLFLYLIALPVIAFILFNVSNSSKLPKLFLGDSGSLFLGFIISFTLIYLSHFNLLHPILLAWSVGIFVFEFISLNMIRFKRKKNIFTPGLDHLHHLIYQKTKSIIKTNLSLILLNLIIFFIGYLSYTYFGSFISLILFIISFLIYYFLRSKLSNSKIFLKI